MRTITGLSTLACFVSVLTAVQGAHAIGGDLLWEDRVGADGARYVASDVAVQGSRVFVVGQSFLPAANDFDGLVRAYDARTGVVLWQDRFESVAAAVTVDDARVFVSGHSGPLTAFKFLVRAYDGKTGDLLWQDRLEEMSYARTVAVHGGRVFAAGGFAGNSIGLILRAYDAQSGTVLWEDRRPAEIFVSGSARHVVLSGNRLYLAATDVDTNRMVVRAYDAGTGSALWEARHSDADHIAVHGTATAGGEVFVVGADGNPAGTTDFMLRAYDAQSGSLLWHHQLNEPGTDQFAATVATAGESVFAGGGVSGADGTTSLLRAYDRRTGALLWEHRGIGGFEITALAGQGNRVLVSDAVNTDLVVRVHDARTGKVEWEDRRNLADGVHYVLGVATKEHRGFAVGLAANAAGDSEFVVRAYTLR